ncbi:type IV pilus inner membrane component PilO [Imhoffiella purpurea]|uniref:Type IV pilus biogenesis protein PilO n=1 Tax=Imhoffiella purpurea TaxID=1249627 RepID=W9VBY4_9GAMM|nr:type 4a pilus biogenesis protein PilO [Imhoffiella purpurea]EXJ17098.1 Type IV pilus biogenesis protein PilO [Imhoffiella purpurea]
MDLNELNELDLSTYGEWPLPVKVIAILLACAALGGLAYYMDTKDQRMTLEREQRTEVDLRRSLVSKQEKAVNLNAYKNQLAEMKETFGAMLRQLPNKTEVASLLVDVSQTGLANGLEFELFQPDDELKKDFYAELPIRIRVLGTYHDFGRFVSGLAALPRIVTVHDVQILDPSKSPRNQRGQMDTKLNLQATLKTYRYLDEETAQ